MTLDNFAKQNLKMQKTYVKVQKINQLLIF